MDKILKRDEFVQLVEQKKYEDLQMVNEGLLKNLFGAIKNLFKKDWETVKGDPGIISAYKEMDDKLTGFSMMKLSKKDECNQIRQVLVDFACDWYDLKMNKAKEDDADPKPAKSMKFKNDTLRENLDSMRNKIKDIAKDDEQMLKWANTLLEDMKVVINRVILDDIKDEEVKKELEEKIAKETKIQDEINKKMEDWQNGQLKEIDEERKKLISDVSATAVDNGLSGSDAIGNLTGEFKKVLDAKNNKERADAFQKDELLGLKGIFVDEDYDNTEFIETSAKLMEGFYEQLNKDTDKFKEVPGPSVQAMCISVNGFIKNCMYGDDDKSIDKTLPLMAKCAIMSNGTVSYNLPLNGKTGNDAGNYFTDSIAAIMKNAADNGEDLNTPEDFDDNAKKLFERIKKEAANLKEKSEKDYNDKLKKLDLGEKTETYK